MGDMDGVRISFDDRLEDDEHRLLHTEEDDEDEDEGEREPLVDMIDGAYDEGDSGGGVVELIVVSSIDFGIVFFVCCSKFLRSSDTLGYVNDSVSEGVRADIAETVVSELFVIVVDACNA